MQPTGRLHLGHLLGVLNNYVELQKQYDCYFMIANWHSLTAFYGNYGEAHGYIHGIVSDWLAAGLDPEKCTIFLQSDVREHAELNLILGMYTPVSWLLRNPTYKEKQENVSKDIDSYGFLGYPVLQAADILLYDAELVPIGEDQLPHLELTREIARRFNHLTGDEIFTVPQAKLSSFPKVSGTDGRKMSKSYNNTLTLSQSEEELNNLIKTMKTDTNRVRRSDPGNPDVCPVFSYYDFFMPEKKEEIASECRSAGIGCIDCKKLVGSRITDHLAPFRERRKALEGTTIVTDILEQGRKKAEKSASATMSRTKKAMGFP